MACAAAAAFFLYWALDGLSEQGLYLDVAIHGVHGLGVYKGFSVASERFLNIFGRAFPLMFTMYNGAAEVYAAVLPALFLFGNTAWALNVASVAWGGIVLVCTGALAGLYFRDVRAAFVAMALLAASPSFVAASRIGLYAGTVHGGFFAAALTAFAFFAKTRTRGALVFGALALGASWAGRLLMVWYVAALILLGVSSRSVRRAWSEISIRTRVACAVFVSAGLWPVLIANILGGWFTLSFMSEFLLTSRGGVSNLNYLGNLGERLSHLLAMARQTAWTQVAGPNDAAALMLASAAAAAFFPAGREGAQSSGRWPLAVMGLVLLQSPFTPTILDVHHLFPLYPVLALFLTAPFFIRRRDRPIRFFKVGYAVLFLASLWTGARAMAGMGAHRSIHGGHEVRWNLAGDVLEWLEREEIHALGLGDTGLMDPLLFLSGSRLEVREVFFASYQNIPMSEQKSRLERSLAAGTVRHYLFRAEGLARIDFFAEFQRHVAKAGKRLEAVKSFATPEGEPALVVFRVS